MSHPYTVGSSIVLMSSTFQKIDAKIVGIETMTLSCVMVIQLNFSSELRLLKLYDRRFAEQLRRDEDVSPWNEQVEQSYQEFLRTGEQSTLFSRWSNGFRQDQFWEDEQRGQWSQAVLEAYLQFHCQKTYSTEKHAYHLMRDMQGAYVPRFHGDVFLRSSDISSTCVDKYLDCPGIILQYVPGFPLTDLAKNVEPQHWQCICETAIYIIHQIGNRGICNKDVKTRSFILTKNNDYSDPRLFMIDFGLCVFRSQARNEDEFREWQADQDEEGAIGCVMERLLKGNFSYHRSPGSLCLLNDFKSEEK